MTRTVTRRTVRSPGTSPALPSLHAFMLHLIPPAAQLQSAFALSRKTNDKDNIWGQFHYGASRLKVLSSLYAQAIEVVLKSSFRGCRLFLGITRKGFTWGKSRIQSVTLETLVSCLRNRAQQTLVLIAQTLSRGLKRGSRYRQYQLLS